MIACMPKWDATEKDASERSIGCERFVVLPRGGDYERCRDRWGFRTIVYRVSIYSRIGFSRWKRNYLRNLINKLTIFFFVYFGFYYNSTIQRCIQGVFEMVVQVTI